MHEYLLITILRIDAGQSEKTQDISDLLIATRILSERKGKALSI